MPRRPSLTISRPLSYGLLALLGSFACTSTTPAPVDGGGAPVDAIKLDVWAGVPPISPDPADIATELRPVDGPKPPPGVDTRVELPFPPPAPPSKQTQDQAPVGPLKVLRTSPTQKEPGLVGQVTAVFNQAMVPLASVDDLKLERSPLKISPQPPGKFRWLGTQMIAFEPEGRLPFSTTYTAEVEAGETSTAGVKLGKRVQWKFSTPPLQIEWVWPSSWVPAGLDTPIVLRFNQDIQADKLAAAIELVGGGPVAFTAVPASAWADLPHPTRAHAQSGAAGRTLVLRPNAPLRPNTAHTLTIPAGAYGEGPNASKPITAKFRTFPPLSLTAPRCATNEYLCRPEYGIHLGTSNRLVDGPELQKQVRVTPEVPDLVVSARHGLVLQGKFRGLTSYTIEVDAGVRDVHGQTLARPFRATVVTRPLEPSLRLLDAPRDPVVLEPSHAGVLELRAAGLTDVDVRSRGLNPDELAELLKRRHDRSGDEQWLFGLDGAPQTHHDVGSSRVEAVDLELRTRELARMPGQFLLVGARSNVVDENRWSRRQSVDRIVEVTRLGVTAAFDHDRGVVFVTDIDTGEPLADVDLALRTPGGTRPLWSGKTDARGLAELAHDRIFDDAFIIASAAGDVAYAPLTTTVDGRYASWKNERPDDQGRAFIFTDRQPYKPGETVHLAGILREETRGPTGGVQMFRADVDAEYTVRGPRGHEVAKGATRVGPLGTFSVDIPLPPDGDLGDYNFNLELPGGLFGDPRSFGHSFAVEAYRAPEFEVKVERASDSTLVYGDTLAADVRASYLHGAPMVGADVHYTLRRSDAGFRPPGSENESFSFGPVVVPWWGSGGRSLWGGDDGWYGGLGGGFGGPWRGADVLVKQGDGKTDAGGVFNVSHVLQAQEEPWDAVPGQAPPKADASKPEDPPSAGTYTLEASVVDQNRQAIAGRQSFVVHASDEYVGVRSDRSVYKEGERARLEAIVADVAGKRVDGREIQLDLLRRETRRDAVEDKGTWRYKVETVDVPAGSCALVSAAGPVGCEIAVDRAGTYVARAKISDAKGRPAVSRHNLYVHGKDAVVWDQDQRRVDLVPDKRTYEPGESAKLLVRSPFDRAHGLVLIEREGIVEHRTLTVEGGAATLDVPLTEAMTPGVEVAVLLVRGRIDVPGAPAGQDLGRPAFAVGQVELAVADTRKRIALALKPGSEELAPKDTLTLEIQARDADGAAQRAAVAVMVVDEGVLSLMAYKTPDPLAFYHHRREPDVGLYDLRTYLMARPESDTVTANGSPADPEMAARQAGILGVMQSQSGHFLASPYGGAFAVGNDDADVWGGLTGTEAGDAYGVGGLGLRGTGRGGGGVGLPGLANKQDEAEEDAGYAALDASRAMSQPISLRALFATTAYYNPEVLVDASGTATLEIPMPENLTTFRVMAVAVDPDRPDRFGSAETRVKVRKPIMLRPSLPRFANFGDSFQASVMVDNQTEEPQAIVVATRGANVGLPGATTVPVEVPAGQSREVRFPMTTEKVGTMRLQFAALSNGGRDATETSLPVLLPATRQAFADYGVTDTSVARAIKVPDSALPGFGGLEVSMSSTALRGLEDAVKFLVDYQYECTEQVASRLLPIFMLGPVLEQFPIATVRDLEGRDRIAVAGISRILGRQNYDGGFRYWDGADDSSPYLTAWTAFALLEGKNAGFKVDADALTRAVRYLENYIERGEVTRWGRFYDDTTRAFALWLISRHSGRGRDLFDRVYNKRRNIPLYAHALLMAAADTLGRTGERDALLKDFRARVTETARTAHFAESVSEGEAAGLHVLMHSDVQTDAVALMALLQISPTDPLLPKIMAGIMDSRDPRAGGRWGTTHANAWALLAASRYFTTVEKQVPDYVARVWLDTAFAGEQTFKGRSMATTDLQVPMARLMKEQPREVLLAKDGPGKLYYRLGLRYAPADLNMKAESQGFSVFRTYEALGNGGNRPDPEAVKRLPDGSWQIQAGATVRVHLTLVARDRANFVVVDDPLPAGFEGQNPRFSTSLPGVAATVSDVSWRGGGSTPLGDWDDGWWWWRPWWSFSHTELRDDRMLLFANELPAGVYTYSYTARATTIGEFKLPPVHAEAMYAPELFGHGASTTVRVVE